MSNRKAKVLDDVGYIPKDDCKNNYFIGVDFAKGCETTIDSEKLEKYCSICKKVCGHWAKEHDSVFGDNR